MYLNFIEAHCSAVDFVFKGDDDVLINPKIVSNVIRTHLLTNKTAHCPFTWGCKKYDKPIRNPGSKYFIPEIIWPNHVLRYPPYFAGACYVLSGKLAVEMARIQQQVPLFPLDDVYIGILAQKLNMTSCFKTGKITLLKI